jgi:hypothetical protein
MGGAAWSNSGDLAGELGRGVAGGSRAREGSTRALTCGGEVAGGQRQHGQATVAAGAVAPARMWPGLGNKRRQARL